MKHELKCLPEYFQEVFFGRKTFEIRKDDRGFKVGDTLLLHEWNGTNYTGNACTVEVTYITSFPEGLHGGYVCMSICKAASTEPASAPVESRGK